MISVIIPAYNEEKYLPLCLDALKKQNFKGKLEIIVVDNGSSDRTADVARGYGIRVVTEKHRGITWARQKGLEESRGDIIVAVDADMVLTPNWLTLAVKNLKANPKTAAVKGTVFYYGVKNQETEALLNFFNLTLCLFEVVIKNLVRRGILSPCGSLAVKREFLLKAGGWNREIDFYGEDLDLVNRLMKISRVKYLPHLVSYTSFRRFRKEGLVKTYLNYSLNGLWLILFRRPFRNNESMEKLAVKFKSVLNKIEDSIEKNEGL